MSNVNISDLRSTTVPKSTQLNADQLIVGTMDLTITEVSFGPDEKQPIAVHYENEAGRPFLPCLTMRRVLLAAWGPDGNEWVGKGLRVFHDPAVRFGGDDVGGVRISHMTDIPGRRIELKLTAARGKKVLYVIERMEQAASGPTLAHVLQLITVAANAADMKAAKAAAQTLADPADVEEAVRTYNARVAEQRAKTQKQATKAFSEWVQDIDNAADKEAAEAILIQAMAALTGNEVGEIQTAFNVAWSDQ